MSTPKTATIDGEMVAFMNAKLCSVVRPNFEFECAAMKNPECRCPGAPLHIARGHGIWITKAQYLELRLMGEVE